MTKQEEIKEGMADILEVWMDRDMALATARTIMAKEHYQGVVVISSDDPYTVEPLI